MSSKPLRKHLAHKDSRANKVSIDLSRADINGSGWIKKAFQGFHGLDEGWLN